MSKPMYCPMSFANRSLTEPHYMSIGDQHGQYVEEVKPWMECTPDCAWALKLAGNSYGCGIAAIAIRGTSEEVAMNARPLEDDDE